MCLRLTIASWFCNRGLRRGQVVHEEDGAEHRDDDRQHPHQPGIRQIEAAGGRRLVEIDQADAHQDRSEQLHAGDADIAAGCVEAERPALHPVGIEEGDVGHRGGEVAAAETGKGRDQQHQPERRIGLADEIGQTQRRNQQHTRREDGPVAAAERRHREGIGKAHQGADQARKRNELEQLVGGEVKACRRQLGRHDRPDRPDRKADILGDDRPDQIAPGNELACRIPEGLVLGIPFRNPRRILIAHTQIPFSSLVVCRHESAFRRDPGASGSRVQMMAFEDGSGGVRRSYSSFVPARAEAEMADRLMCYEAMPEISASADSHSKFAIRSFLVRRTNHEQHCLHNHQSAAYSLRSSANRRPNRKIIRRSGQIAQRKSDGGRPAMARQLLIDKSVNEDCGSPDVEAVYRPRCGNS